MTDTSERSIFLQALELGSADARNRYLDDVCAGDSRLRKSVENLLNAHELPANPLDHPVASFGDAPSDQVSSTILQNAPIVEGPGTVIGPYRLMEQIGEGGFGLVFVAQQQRPVQRKVALKVVKPGMDSREVVARFEAERQALALMDHPNIASVLDAGTTDTGRPYFVMELVRGVPITQFCDQQELSLRSRLELFVKVCNAVQHAHQKGVIHRDIKPSNVLVTLHDDVAVPKVIDFGVAKAVGQNLTDKTIYTRFSAMIGTPLYMSPEQAQMSGLDVDTRSDIYSLGVVLYELLTGLTPFERKRFDSVGIDEVRRIIREEEPPKPSTRVTTAATARSTVSAPRLRGLPDLSTTIRGDLDWIVMKTLEKDRGRRYESAGELADDVRRFLNQQPIEARPPSTLYQWQKFARRNQAALVTCSLIVAALILGLVASLWQASVAVSERNEKDAALKAAVRLQREADKAREEIAQFASRMKEANILVTSGRAHADAERWSAAYADFSDAIERQPNYYNAWIERASLLVKLGLWDRAAQDYAKAIELGVPADHPANWGIPQLFLFTGDIKSYREYCRSMLLQSGRPNEPLSLSLIRSCVMASQPVGDLDFMADQSLILLQEKESHRRESPPPPPQSRGMWPPGPPPERTGFDSRPPHRSGPPRRRDAGRSDHPFGATYFIAGVALYRAERFDEAIDGLNRALEDDRWRAKEVVYPVLAMAYHRTGDAEQARAAFVKSEQAISDWTEKIVNGPVGTTPIPWFDWIECLLLHREASILLTQFAPAEDPRLRQVQTRSAALLEQP